MAVLVVDTDRRRQIPSEFIWVMQGLAKGGKELYTPAELGGVDQWLKRTWKR